MRAVQGERMRFDAAAAGQNARAKNENAPQRRWWSGHVADAAAMFVAAGVLIAVMIPAVAHVRYDYRRTLCAANLSEVKTAMDRYASIWHGELPTLGVSADGNWLHPAEARAGGVEEGHTNTANLLPLILASYITPNRLICPGRDLPAGTAISYTASDIPDSDYSYVNLFGRFRATWDGKDSTIVLADRNPLFCGEAGANAEMNSRNHEGHGNYVVRGDGHVTWEVSPDIGPGRDNIWTVNDGTQRLLTYTGTETAGSPGDVFLAP